jgi:phosphoserine phosphatase
MINLNTTPWLRTALDLNTLPSERLLRILDLTKKLAAPFDLSSMLDEVLQAGLDVLDADSGSLWLYHEEDERILMHLPVVDPPIAVKKGEGLVGECLLKNQVINVPDCYADDRFNPDVDKKTGYRTESILSIPLIGFDSSLVGVLQLLNKRGGPFTEVDESMALALAAQSAVALQRAQWTESLIAKERMDEEIALAREVQMSTLPDEMPVLEGYGFSSGFIPAEFTGGDLFDLVNLENEVFILVGDATGHGVGPAISATQMQAMFRVALRTGASLDDAYIHVNNQLVEDLQDNKFLTAFIGFLNNETHTIRYHSAGQGPIVHYRAAENRCEWYPPTSFPVGVMNMDSTDPPVVVELDPGDIFAVISDGVFEYHNEADEQFGEERVGEILCAFEGVSMDELRQDLLDEVFAFGGEAEQLDDITIVLVGRDPDSTSKRALASGTPLNLNCDRDNAEIERIVDATAAFFERNAIDTSIRGVVDFAIEEMFTNMVKYNQETKTKIDIELETEGDGIRVTLTDYNVDRFDPTERAEVDINAPVDQRTPGGLGVFLTLKLVDSFTYDYHNRTSKITIIKRQDQE